MTYRVVIEGPSEPLDRPIEEVLAPGVCIRVDTSSGPIWLVGEPEDCYAAPMDDGRTWDRSLPLACIQSDVGFGVSLRRVLSGLYYHRRSRSARVGVPHS